MSAARHSVPSMKPSFMSESDNERCRTNQNRLYYTRHAARSGGTCRIRIHLQLQLQVD